MASAPEFRFHPAVDLDYDEALGWYHRRSVRAAEGFEDAVKAALESVRSNPLWYGVVRNGFRRCPLHRYPFGIIYQIKSDHIFVLAIAHGKREKFWRQRI